MWAEADGENDGVWMISRMQKDAASWRQESRYLLAVAW